MRVNRLPALPILAPAGTPAIELASRADYSTRIKQLDLWERDQAYDDDLLPAHERAQLVNTP